ncbi:MAG: hypothetical protein ABI621_17240 [Chloroflexota bacterium]
MKNLLPLKLAIFGLLTLIWVSAVTAIAASNTIPATRAESRSATMGPNHIKPSACAGLSLAITVSGSGTMTGTAGNDLILGGPGADTIDGLGGNDCILGGGGDDIISGGDGTDVCLGGPGNDTFIDCEGESQ